MLYLHIFTTQIRKCICNVSMVNQKIRDPRDFHPFVSVHYGIYSGSIIWRGILAGLVDRLSHSDTLGSKYESHAMGSLSKQFYVLLILFILYSYSFYSLEIEIEM